MRHWTVAELMEHWTLLPEERILIDRSKGNHNRLDFAILLKYFQPMSLPTWRSNWECRLSVIRPTTGRDAQ
jgi:hypothetical protein